MHSSCMCFWCWLYPESPNNWLLTASELQVFEKFIITLSNVYFFLFWHLLAGAFNLVRQPLVFILTWKHWWCFNKPNCYYEKMMYFCGADLSLWYSCLLSIYYLWPYVVMRHLTSCLPSFVQVRASITLGLLCNQCQQVSCNRWPLTIFLEGGVMEKRVGSFPLTFNSGSPTFNLQ